MGVTVEIRQVSVGAEAARQRRGCVEPYFGWDWSGEPVYEHRLALAAIGIRESLHEHIRVDGSSVTFILLSIYRIMSGVMRVRTRDANDRRIVNRRPGGGEALHDIPVATEFLGRKLNPIRSKRRAQHIGFVSNEGDLRIVGLPKLRGNAALAPVMRREL